MLIIKFKSRIMNYHNVSTGTDKEETGKRQGREEEEKMQRERIVRCLYFKKKGDWLF